MVSATMIPCTPLLAKRFMICSKAFLLSVKLSLNVLNEVAQVVIICVSTVVLYCQIFAFVFKAGIWPGCRCASDHISETAYRFAMPLAGEL